jgi:hypothetical protein
VFEVKSVGERDIMATMKECLRDSHSAILGVFTLHYLCCMDIDDTES